MRPSRSNFDGFNNRDVWEEGKKALERRKKRRKRIRNFSLVTFSGAGLLIILVFLRPEYFSFFSLAQISGYLSNLYPEQLVLPAIETEESKVSTTIIKGSTTYPEYHFTKEDVDKASREMLKQHRGRKPKSAHIQNLIKENKEGNFLYEIELLSGKRIYAESAKLDNNIISVEDNKGIVIELGIDQIVEIRLNIKTEVEQK